MAIFSSPLKEQQVCDHFQIIDRRKYTRGKLFRI